MRAILGGIMYVRRLNSLSTVLTLAASVAKNARIENSPVNQQVINIAQKKRLCVLQVAMFLSFCGMELSVT